MLYFIVSSFFIVLVSTILHFGFNVLITVYNLFLFYTSLYETLIFYLSMISLITFLVSLILIPILISRIPYDYFSYHRKNAKQRFKFLKSILGVLLILFGLVMLITPGQGIITMFIGLLFLDFPKRYEVEIYMLKKFNLLDHLNWIRRKFSKPEFSLD